MESRLIRNTILATTGVLTQGAARFLVTMLIGRYFPDRLGETSSVLSLSQYLTLFWPAPAGMAATKFLGQYHNQDSKSRGILRLLTKSVLLFTAVAVLISLPVAYFFSSDAMAASFSALFVASFGAYLFTRGALLGAGNVSKSTLLDIVTSVLTLVLLLAVLNAGLSSLLLLPLAVGFGLYSVFAWPSKHKGPLSLEDRIEVLTFTRHNIFGMIAAGGLLPATMILVQVFARESADLFAAALTLATPANLLAQSITQVLTPHLAADHAAGNSQRKTAIQWFAASVSAFFIIFSTLIMLGPWLLGVVFPGQFEAGSVALAWLLAIVGAQSCAAVPTAVLLSTGKQKKYALICFVATATGTLMMAIGIPLFGLAGAIAGFAAGSVGSALFITYAGLRGGRPTVG